MAFIHFTDRTQPKIQTTAFDLTEYGLDLEGFVIVPENPPDKRRMPVQGFAPWHAIRFVQYEADEAVSS